MLSADPVTSVAITPPIFESYEEGEILVTYTFPEGMHQNLNKEVFFFSVEGPYWLDLEEIAYPSGSLATDIEYYGSVTISASFTIPEEVKAGTWTLKVTSRYQLCDSEGVCFFPEQEEMIIDLVVGSGGTAGFSLIALLKFILMAFAGGILLNIMPCVLPLLSIKAISLINMREQSRRDILFNALSYGAGILASMLILAGLVILLKLSGELVGWGFQFQNPLFVIILLSVVFIFSLSLFDIYVISVPGMNLAARASGRSGNTGSFLTGIFAVLLATPCTAPLMGAALGFAFSQPPVAVITIFTSLGIGFALPFVLLGIFPGLIKRIPKPGPWMDIFKTLMAFLLLGTVVWLLDVLSAQVAVQQVVKVISFLLFLALASWIYGLSSKPGSPPFRQIIGIAAAILIIAVSGVLLISVPPDAENGGEQILLDEGWESFSPESLETYRAQGFPVFLEFSAKWCKTCEVNKKAILSQPDVLSAFESYGVKLLHGDFTRNDPVIAGWIRKFGKAGVPVYALYVPGKEKPIIFPEILSKGMIFDSFSSHLSPAIKSLFDFYGSPG
jgi:thiol:disulfide interchange protein DsbD